MALGRQVHADPADAGAVAGFATDAVGDLEGCAAQPLGHVVGVAVETDIGLVGRFQAQVAGDALGLLLQQHLVSLRVRVLALPSDIFVLEHVGLGPWLDRAVTGAAGACGHAEMDVFGRVLGPAA